jgi:hypothetical protein
MIGVAVGNERTVDRAAGIDPAFGRGDVDSMRLGFDPGKGGCGHFRFK